MKQILNREPEAFTSLQPRASNGNVQRFNENFENNTFAPLKTPGSLTQKVVDRAYSQTKQSVFSQNKSALSRVSLKPSHVSKNSVFAKHALDNMRAEGRSELSQAKSKFDRASSVARKDPRPTL